MHGGEVDAVLAEHADGARHGFRNIKELQVGEHMLVVNVQPVDQFVVVARHEQFQTHLVKVDGIAQLIHQRLGLVGGGQVKGHDEAFMGRDRFVREQVGHGESWKFGAIARLG